ncbi:hypothetical protein HDV06_005567 [Boothiomyces sp. JEL0866]|nr:hypothetical protein HDV06_005567 [Boothiomyces sp. JEL0866]
MEQVCWACSQSSKQTICKFKSHASIKKAFLVPEEDVDYEEMGMLLTSYQAFFVLAPVLLKLILVAYPISIKYTGVD